SVVVEVDKLDMVQALQEEVAGVVEDIGALVVVGGCQEALKSHPVMKVLSGMQFVTNVRSSLVEGVQNGQPSVGKLLKSGFHQAGGALGPWIHGVPHEGSAKGSMGGQAHILGGFCGIFKLLYSPFGFCLKVAL